VNLAFQPVDFDNRGETIHPSFGTAGGS
jgi:hypothetical protein